jgi:hypothetical protein
MEFSNRFFKFIVKYGFAIMMKNQNSKFHRQIWTYQILQALSLTPILRNIYFTNICTLVFLHLISYRGGVKVYTVEPNGLYSCFRFIKKTAKFGWIDL